MLDVLDTSCARSRTGPGCVIKIDEMMLNHSSGNAGSIQLQHTIRLQTKSEHDQTEKKIEDYNH